ncbi:MAG: hypothetical protein EU547_02685 [Promethearchaeota archaeon]|nr:MAG: hypothetical protein EU547_02685 [Candidatus Lokiarchaeota archaeon]
MNTDRVHLKLKIEVPKTKWLSKFNEKYPNLKFHILSKFLLDEDTGNTLLKVYGVRIEQFLKELHTIPKHPSFQILYNDKNLAILNVKINDPWVLIALIKTELLIEYPIKVEEGFLFIESFAKRTVLDQFLEVLENKKIHYQIESIGYFHRRTLLTEKQKKVLTLAFNRGYFEIPRKITLKSLAKKLEVSRSALSEMFRRIFKKLTEDFLS